MEMTPDEREFLRKYRRLDAIDRARVDERINEMEHDNRKRQFTIYEEEKPVKKSSYETRKADARQYAIDRQRFIADNNLSYGELAEIQADLYELGRKYGLVREFRENGIL